MAKTTTQFPITTDSGRVFNSEAELTEAIARLESQIATKNRQVAQVNVDRADALPKYVQPAGRLSSGHQMRADAAMLERYEQFPITHARDIPEANAFYQRQWEKSAELQTKYPHASTYIGLRVSKQVAALKRGGNH
jgi:hypothetical protein